MQTGDLVHIPQDVTMLVYEGEKQLSMLFHKTKKPELAIYLGEETQTMWRFPHPQDTSPRVYWKGREWLVNQRDLFPLEENDVGKTD